MSSIMLWSSLFDGKTKKSPGAILIDIGSGSIAGGIVVFDEDKKPEIVFETREHFPVHSRLNNSLHMSYMINALNQVAWSISQKGVTILASKGKKIDYNRVICHLSSPWHISTTKSIHFNFKKPFSISPTFIEDILGHEGRSYLEETKQKGGAVEHEIFQVKINGYPVRYPIGKNANEFEMILFLSAFPQAINREVRKVIGKYFHQLEPEFHSATVAYFHILEKLFKEEGNYIAVEISGEATDISVIKGGIISETASFPLGRNFIVRRLLNESKGITTPVALSMIKANAEKSGAAKLSDKMRNVILQAEKDWIDLFIQAVRDFSADLFLPTKAFICSLDGSAKMFSLLLSDKDLTVRGSGTEKIVAEAVDLSVFENLVSSSRDEERDPFLAIDAIFAKDRYFS